MLIKDGIVAEHFNGKVGKKIKFNSRIEYFNGTSYPFILSVGHFL